MSTGQSFRSIKYYMRNDLSWSESDQNQQNSAVIAERPRASSNPVPSSNQLNQQIVTADCQDFSLVSDRHPVDRSAHYITEQLPADDFTSIQLTMASSMSSSLPPPPSAFRTSSNGNSQLGSAIRNRDNHDNSSDKGSRGQAQTVTDESPIPPQRPARRSRGQPGHSGRPQPPQRRRGSVGSDVASLPVSPNYNPERRHRLYGPDSPPHSLPIFTAAQNSDAISNIYLDQPNQRQWSFESSLDGAENTSSLNNSISLNDSELNELPKDLNFLDTSINSISNDNMSETSGLNPIMRQTRKHKYTGNNQTFSKGPSNHNGHPSNFQKGPSHFNSGANRAHSETQTPTWSKEANKVILKLQEPLTSWEEQFAKRLFLGRRCWSFMSRQKYDRNQQHNFQNFQNQIGNNQSHCCSNSSKIMYEMKLLQAQNEELKRELSSINDRLKQLTISRDNEAIDESESFTQLMSTIMVTQREREQLIEDRLAEAYRERDIAIRQLNELVQELIQSNQEETDLTQLVDNSSDDDEIILELSKSAPDGLTEDVPESDIEALSDQLSFTKMQLKHEIKLRLIQQRKAKRMEKVVTNLQEKVARFSFLKAGFKLD